MSNICVYYDKINHLNEYFIMAYTKDDWEKRIAERSDMSTSLIHLTKGNSTQTVIDVLYSILKNKKIKGSTTSGFIVGNEKAVCFQDAPLYSICQNTFFEQKKREKDVNYKLRYRAFGLLFDKQFMYNKGARPVIYEKTEIAKAFLPSREHWRIVNFNLESDTSIIDWTHEREWRIKGNFEFELSNVTILAIRQDTIKTLISKFNDEGINLMNEIKGIVTLEHLLY